MAGVNGWRETACLAARRPGAVLPQPGGAMMATPITVTGITFTPGAPVVLFPTRIVGDQGWQDDVAPDGRFLINTPPDSTAATPITLLQNWHPEAKR
jgi:hypothetical protein